VAESFDKGLEDLIKAFDPGDPALPGRIVKKLKGEGRETEIEDVLKKLKDRCKLDTYLAYCEGSLLSDYLNDMAIAQEFASWNRKAIIYDILKAMKLKAQDQFTTIHNYIDLDCMILRKGAISAQKGERVLIPMNMRDGSLLCIGKGNPDWNFSAPHGAGRLMSRSEALNSLTVSAFERSMEGIYSTSISHGTLDESPMAYKPMDEIISCIGDTVEIVGRVKPIYNFKAEG
jgi:RNA-splicing ligase RtcB